jgi:FkbM family methyltransferase
MTKFFQKLKNSFRKRRQTIRNLSIRGILIKLNLVSGNYMVFDGIKVPFRKITKASLLELERGSYEDMERGFMESYLPRGAFVVELGASIGIISCHILKKKPVRLISFEAVEKWAQIARETLKLNYPKDTSFELVHAALGAVGQSQVIFNTTDHCNLGGHILSAASDTSIVVPALSLFDVNRIYHVPAGAWLIMDIEGTEWEIIKNQSDALDKYDGVIVECHKTIDDEIIITPTRIVNEFTLGGFTLIEKANHGTHIVAVFKRTAKRHQ